VQGTLLPGAKATIVSVERRPGGQMATAMVACRRLGLRVRYGGAFGDDAEGRWLEAEIARRGVIVHAIRRRCATRQAWVLVDAATGERTVLERRDPRLDVPGRALPTRALLDARVLLLDATDVRASLALARAARARGIPVMLDVDRPVAGLSALLPTADILSVSAEFPAAYTGDRRIERALSRLAMDTRAPLVVATLGGDGSLALAAGTFVRTPAMRVTPVDTTGAGDVFRAGLLAAWIRGQGKLPVEALLTYANAAAGLSTRGAGAWGALPRWADLEVSV
jgi:sugar/nucleoside kinase (ribokinase family)